MWETEFVLVEAFESAAESRDSDVASVEAVLRTEEEEEAVEEEEDDVAILAEVASMELTVEARLCLDALLRSMLRGREGGALRPELRPPERLPVLEAGGDNGLADDASEEDVFADDALDKMDEGKVAGVAVGGDDREREDDDDQRRPRKREAAVAMADDRSTLAQPV